MAWLWYLLLLVTQCFGLMFTLLGLPGLWVMAAAMVGYAWVTGLNRFVGWPGIVTVVALAVIAEILEFIAGSAGAKKAGGSRRAMIGAMVGALVGGFLFTIPVPILGTIFGVCAGAFVGAAIVEMGVVGDPAHAGRVGMGAARGRLVGILLKAVFGIAIFLFTIFAAFPL
ncbi:MAG TPA: DUF456 domain-containing protein [Tepidisphaeraceae bacterium]|jgi:hypothetical protein